MKTLRVVYFWGAAMLIGISLSGQPSPYTVQSHFRPSLSTELLTKSYFIRPKGHWDNEFNTYNSLLAHTAKLAIYFLEGRQFFQNESTDARSFAQETPLVIEDVTPVVSGSSISFANLDLSGYDYTLISVEKGEWRQRGRIYKNSIDTREVVRGPYLLILHDNHGAYYSCQLDIVDTHQ